MSKTDIPALINPNYMKSPWPYPGGKARVTPLTWQALGDVDNFIDPFCGTNAFLLGRPGGPKGRETVNDANCFVANFWRAMSTESGREALPIHMDWPVNEADMRARHSWLCKSEQSKEFIASMQSDPDYVDYRIAGWWAWGQCLQIGAAWCDQDRIVKEFEIEGSTWSPTTSRPQLADAFSRGRGVHANDSADTCEARRAWLKEWCLALRDRLRSVRVCCGDWQRVCSSTSVTTRLGLTGIVLDPPYHSSTGRSKKLYGKEDTQVSEEVEKFCLENARKDNVRIILFGLDGEHDAIDADGWVKIGWKSSGYQNVSREGQARAKRERIWLSPHCLTPKKEKMPLFHEADR